MTARDVEALLRWYRRVRRPLPWRFTHEPYAILVSEVMLQQTQAVRVVGYFERWMERFPDPAALAAAPVRDVLTAWSGLGYNRRALALQAAARRVAADGWPPPDRLGELPGVGPYTAAALASFAWAQPVAAVDTNVRRVLERHDGRRRTPAALRGRAARLLPPARAADFNQAMMELGATVCRARRPACGGCPVRPGCAWAGRGSRAPAPLHTDRRKGGAAPERPPRGRTGRVEDGAASAGSPRGRSVRIEDRAASAGSPRGRSDGAASERSPRGRRARVEDGAAPAGSAGARRVRFEDTDRWARGRIVAALVAGEPSPALDPARRERALAGLERDGLVTRGADGEPRLP